MENIEKHSLKLKAKNSLDFSESFEIPEEGKCEINQIKSVLPEGKIHDNCLVLNKGSVKLIDRIVFSNQNYQTSFSCDDLKILEKKDHLQRNEQTAFEFSFRRPNSTCAIKQDEHEESKNENISSTKTIRPIKSHKSKHRKVLRRNKQVTQAVSKPRPVILIPYKMRSESKNCKVQNFELIRIVN